MSGDIPQIVEELNTPNGYSSIIKLKLGADPENPCILFSSDGYGTKLLDTDADSLNNRDRENVLYDLSVADIGNLDSLADNFADSTILWPLSTAEGDYLADVLYHRGDRSYLEAVREAIELRILFRKIEQKFQQVEALKDYELYLGTDYYNPQESKLSRVISMIPSSRPDLVLALNFAISSMYDGQSPQFEFLNSMDIGKAFQQLFDYMRHYSGSIYTRHFDERDQSIGELSICFDGKGNVYPEACFNREHIAFEQIQDRVDFMLESSN